MTEFCDSAATRGHETFGCLELVGHELPHRGSVESGECPACHGLAEHADGCPRSDETADHTQPLLEIVWGDDGVVRTEPWEPS